MTRLAQAAGRKGSQKWLQRAVARSPDLLQPPKLPPLGWLSPLQDDAFAEYMDAAFLERLGLAALAPALASFWPRSGPRWDGLARTGNTLVLVEAKSHLREAFSTPMAATSPASRAQITAALEETRAALGAGDDADWTRSFYQYTNRLAHLWFLHRHGIDAHLLFVGFLDDTEQGGPSSPEAWAAFYRTADHVLGLPRRHPLAGRIHHVTPRIGDIG